MLSKNNTNKLILKNRSVTGGAIETAYRTKSGSHWSRGKNSSPQNFQFMWKQHQNTTILSKLKSSNVHQISQTKIPFWVDFHADRESKIRFHSECLYREKSEQQVLTQKNKTQKNSELN